ncbi:MAG: hypothetical protein A3D28_04385 [Omnitrophica bacterium RIFCSPHIGHO2_02_FULL_63_14]|nr:MAG: hypothetical protein A3D28_04385 [Omnitrophica bacterium RIFCSPHIGHO2_02_FULL_63_14]
MPDEKKGPSVKKKIQRFYPNVESFKRRRALMPFGPFDIGSRFFDRVLSVRKMKELVFISSARARGR